MLMSTQTFAATTFGSEKAPDDARGLGLLEIEEKSVAGSPVAAEAVVHA